MLKWAGRIILGLVALLIVLAAGAWSYREWRVGQNAAALAIGTGRGVQEAGFVRIGGIDQYVQIRGEDRANPVILLVHGGPGSSTINMAYEALRPWERDFTIVQWDQRGAGHTRLRNPGPPGAPIQRYIEDGIEVAEHVRARLGVEKLILLGWSWGSLLGTEMARLRPDLFYAYVGTGQVVNLEANERVGYQRLLERAQAAGDRNAVSRLREIGPPPYAGMEELVAERQILLGHPPARERGILLGLARLALYAPGYSVADAATLLFSSTQLEPALFDEMGRWDAAAHGQEFALPLFYILGAEDIQTPTELVPPYVDGLGAPSKEIVTIPDAGHFALIVANEEFLAVLNERVRPLAEIP